ncbi:MAG TPA: hypothetical protein VMG80_00295, partial [Solirubrobacteraceae bacterium]|nr:hypothetical protein [Solirubrobacteraceae bacterium]
SALAANGNLCSLTRTVLVKKRVTVKVHGRRKMVTRKVKKSESTKLTMPATFTAQNGAVAHQATTIAVTGCPKKAKSAKKSNKKKSRNRKQK